MMHGQKNIKLYILEFGNWFSLSHIVWIMKTRMICGNDTQHTMWNWNTGANWSKMARI